MIKILSKENNYALVVGVGKRDETEPNLSITVNDARRFGKELIGRGPFIEANVFYCTDDDATKQKLISQLEKFVEMTTNKPADLVIVYFSGHGCIVNDKYYLVCHDTTNIDIPNSGIEGSEFVKKLQAINTDKMLVLLDCCHSNGVAKPIALPFDEKKFLSDGNRVVITASHASQVSYLSNPLSVFTYALVEGLAGKYFMEGDKDVTIFDLAMYVRERVSQLSENLQKPQFNVLNNGQTSNFILTRYPSGEPVPIAFNEEFSLLREDGKRIDILPLPAQDNNFRKQFEWFNLSINQGPGSTLIMNQTINNANDAAMEIINKLVDKVAANKESGKSLRGSSLEIKSEEILEKVLLKDQTLMLIARDEFRIPLCQMLKGEINDFVLLKGQPHSGLSYLRNLVSDISQNYKCFDFFDIDIYELKWTYEDQLITAAHIAEDIATKIGMPYNMKEFKLQPFLNTLRIELDKRASEKRKCFFYLHNFYVDLGSDVKHLIKGLAKIVAMENAESFVILAGYDELDIWPNELKKMTPRITIEQSFTRQQIDLFLERMYLNPKIDFKTKIGKDTFMTSLQESLPEELFLSADRSNVKAIGDAVDIWYEEMQRKLM